MVAPFQTKSLDAMSKVQKRESIDSTLRKEPIRGVKKAKSLDTMTKVKKDEKFGKRKISYVSRSSHSRDRSDSDSDSDSAGLRLCATRWEPAPPFWKNSLQLGMPHEECSGRLHATSKRQRPHDKRCRGCSPHQEPSHIWNCL